MEGGAALAGLAGAAAFLGAGVTGVVAAGVLDASWDGAGAAGGVAGGFGGTGEAAAGWEVAALGDSLVWVDEAGGGGGGVDLAAGGWGAGWGAAEAGREAADWGAAEPGVGLWDGAGVDFFFLEAIEDGVLEAAGTVLDFREEELFRVADRALLEVLVGGFEGWRSAAGMVEAPFRFSGIECALRREDGAVARVRAVGAGDLDLAAFLAAVALGLDGATDGDREETLEREAGG